MGTYVIEGVELDNQVKLVLGDRQQPPRSQKPREYRAEPGVKQPPAPADTDRESGPGIEPHCPTIPSIIHAPSRTFTKYGL